MRSRAARSYLVTGGAPPPREVNSPMACTITAKKPEYTVEQRRGQDLAQTDMSMPEEINRLCNDGLEDLHLSRPIS